MNKTSAPESSQALGVIRYLPGSGGTPEEDTAAFDGWYYGDGHVWARGIYEHWRDKYVRRGWVVALVQGDDVSFPKSKRSAP